MFLVSLVNTPESSICGELSVNVMKIKSRKLHWKTIMFTVIYKVHFSGFISFIVGVDHSKLLVLLKALK